MSLRSYDQDLASIYQGTFSNGSVSALTLVGGVSRNIPGWLNFDVDVDVTGYYLYLVDGRFDANGGPYEADFFIAKRNGNSFERLPPAQFVNINTGELEYAACISRDQLELYFTRLDAPITSTSEPQLYGASRASLDDPFDLPVKISAATGFVEAPTLSPDGNRLYFHKADNGRFVIYTLTRSGL